MKAETVSAAATIKDVDMMFRGVLIVTNDRAVAHLDALREARNAPGINKRVADFWINKLEAIRDGLRSGALRHDDPLINSADADQFGPRLTALERACRMAERKHGMVSPEAFAASAAWCKEWHRVITLRSRLRQQEDKH